LVASYPAVPTGYELGVGVAVQSYDGKLFFGLTADAHVAPDIARLRDYIRECFEELCKAARVKSAPPRAAKPRPAKPTKPAKPAEPVEPSPSTTKAQAPAQQSGTDASVCQPGDLSGFPTPSNGRASDPSRDRQGAILHPEPVSDPSRDRQGAFFQPQPVSV
jgi:hypothetical protein